VIDAGVVLLVQPDVAGPRIDMEEASQTYGSDQSRGGGGGGGEMWVTDEEDRRGGEEESYSEQKKKQQEKVIESIKTAIGLDMWQPDGKGSIRVINSKLVISQTLLGFKLLENALR